MTTETLLPPNATPQELALEQAMRPGADVVAGVGLIRTAKENPPDDWLYWLVWEYGLEDLLPYLPDPRVVLQDGLQWQRIRGTPASIHLALSWLDLSAVVEENEALRRRWYEYSLDPGMVPTGEQLRNLVGLARLSAPVGTILARVFNGYDRRRARLDYTRWSDGSLWSDDSGVWDDELQVDLSFGRVTTSVVQLGDPVTVERFLLFGTQGVGRNLRVLDGTWTLDGSVTLGDPVTATAHSTVVAEHVQYEDRLLWCFGLFDDPPMRNEAIAATVERFLLFGTQGVGRNLRVLDGTWTLDGSVTLGGTMATELPQFAAGHITTTEPEGIIGWSADAGWGDVNWYGI